jgi:hypothetical protein
VRHSEPRVGTCCSVKWIMPASNLVENSFFLNLVFNVLARSGRLMKFPILPPQSQIDMIGHP